MAAADTITITCPACGVRVKEQAGNIRPGLKLPCPSCGNDIVFDPESPRESIRKALTLARRARLMSGGT